MLDRLFDPIHAWEMPFIEALHWFRGPFVDAFFRRLDFFDSSPFLFLLIPIVWHGYSKKSGLRIFYILLLAWWFIRITKLFFAQPRPFHLNPHLGLINVDLYGFPSGAAQTCFLLGTIFIRTFRTWWAWCIGVIYIAMVSLSRVFLGAHFFSDIVGGWLCAALLLLVYYRIFPWVESRFSSYSSMQKAAFIGILSLILFLIFPSVVSMQIILNGMGVVVGLWITERYQLDLIDPHNHPERISRAALAVAGMFALYYSSHFFTKVGFHQSTQVVLPLLIGLWLSLGVNYLFKTRFEWKKV